MMQWLRDRRVWARLLGTTAALGLACGQAAFGQGGTEAPSGPPKVGELVTLKFQDMADRQFKVLKVEKQSDGGYLSQLQDVKTGETITFFDKGDSIIRPADPNKGKDPAPARTKPRANDPLLPQLPPESTPDKNGSVSAGKAKSSASGSTNSDSSQQDLPKKPGLFSRLFGKKPNPPDNSNAQPGATAATSAPAMTAPVNPSPAPALPPPVRPTPGTFSPPPTGSTVEPPRVAPVQPVAPPTQLFPNGSQVPGNPVIPVAPPVQPAPASRIPAIPATPAPYTPPAPMTPGLPSIPIPPGGVSSASSTVVPAKYATPEMAAMIQELRPYVTTLRTARAPSDRIYAAWALSGCRHASSDVVKLVLFQACTHDPCPLVKACCIEELSKLGFFAPEFQEYLRVACGDPSEDVKRAATAAIKAMMPQR